MPTLVRVAPQHLAVPHHIVRLDMPSPAKFKLVGLLTLTIAWLPSLTVLDDEGAQDRESGDDDRTIFENV